VKEVKAGRVEFKLDKGSNLHVAIGKMTFNPNQLEENARAALDAIRKAKPSSLRGHYLESVTISATMSPPLPVDLKEFQA
jgi:large subunit ribosomal protein L1